MSEPKIVTEDSEQVDVFRDPDCGDICLRQWRWVMPLNRVNARLLRDRLTEALGE